MNNQHIIYLKNNEVQKYRTVKAYIVRGIKAYARAKFNGFIAIIDAEANKPLRSYIKG